MSTRLSLVSVAVRVIPCLDVHAGRVVKGVNFVDLRDAGDPVELGAVYDAEGADELTFLDISASAEGRETTLEVVRRTAETVFIPLTVGGGVGSVDDVDTLLRAGADKVAINTGAIRRPEVIAEITRRFGNQVLVLSVDARRAPGTPSGFEVTTHGGRDRGRAGRGRVGAPRRRPRRGRDPAQLDGRRRHHRRLRPGDDQRRPRGRRRAVDRLRRRRHGPRTSRPRWPPGPTRCWPPRVFHFGTLRIAEVKAAIAAAGYPVRELAAPAGRS